MLAQVSCDGAEWIHALVRERAPQAVICLDAFHVVMWTMKALDKVRVRTMTRAGIRDRLAMWALRKNPPGLTTEQCTSLTEIAATNNTMTKRAYGFHSPDALIAMALLTRAGLCPPRMVEPKDLRPHQRPTSRCPQLLTGSTPTARIRAASTGGSAPNLEHRTIILVLFYGLPGNASLKHDLFSVLTMLRRAWRNHPQLIELHRICR